MADIERKLLKLSIDLKQKNLLLNLSNVKIIHFLLKNKDKNDCFIFGTPKCGISLYACLEDLYNLNAEEIYNNNGINFFEDIINNIYYYGSAESHALPFAAGFAAANIDKKIIYLLNDFEIYLGSNIETLNLISTNNLQNIEIHCNITQYNLDIDIFTYIQYIKNITNNLYIHMNIDLKEKFSFLNKHNADNIIYKYEDILN